MDEEGMVVKEGDSMRTVPGLVWCVLLWLDLKSFDVTTGADEVADDDGHSTNKRSIISIGFRVLKI